LALARLERQQRHGVRLRERVNRRHKCVADRVHQRRGGERVPAVFAEKRGDPTLVLQPGHVHVQVHPVDALHFQRDVLGQDFGNTPW
jgi:hypothetical protein